MSLNKLCEEFEGRWTCDWFISNGACNRQNRFMCHVFIDTGKQPVETDVPLYVGEVLAAFPGSKVIKTNDKEMLKTDVAVLKTAKRLKMEEFFGKI